MVGKPLKPDETEELLSTATENFVYGPGLGETGLDLAGVVLFPPYALVLAGNALLSFFGEEPVSISRVLPSELKGDYREMMDGIYSGPGRAVALISGEKYRDRDEVMRRWDEFVDRVEENREGAGR